MDELTLIGDRILRHTSDELLKVNEFMRQTTTVNYIQFFMMTIKTFEIIPELGSVFVMVVVEVVFPR